MASGSGIGNIVYGIGLGLAGKFGQEDCRKNMGMYFILNEGSFRKVESYGFHLLCDKHCPTFGPPSRGTLFRIRATGSLGHSASNLGNSKPQTSKYLARNLLCQCSIIAIATMLQQQCYSNGFSICTIPDLFQFFSN
ncbi:hypothetical protein WN943_014589 [Citrus x changshan-huyou]